MSVAAVAVILAGLWMAPAPPDWRILPAIVAAALAQLLRVRFRTGGGHFYLAWGEAALIIALYLVPAAWLPLTFAVGAGVAFGVRTVIARHRPPATTPEVLATITLAATVGTVISYVVADPYGGPVTPPVVAGLLLASGGYLLVTTSLISAFAGLRDGSPMVGLWRAALWRKTPMSAGNVLVGLGVVILADMDWRWLWTLPLLLVLLHATYASRLRVLEHRRMWQAFARATRALNQPEVEAVGVAGVAGALDVFAVGRAELEMEEPDRERRWTGEHSGEVRALPPRAADEPEGTVVPLLVAGERVGTMRLHFPNGAGPGRGDDAALQAYADAVAAALHDTVTHAELHELLARSAHDAQHDPLTGLLNRTTLMARGETAVQLVPHADPVVLLLVDVDHFREINDTLGHAAGDELLKVTTARLQHAARPGELLARLGGDEFALLQTNPEAGPGGALRGAVRRGRDLVAQLAETARVSGVSVSIDASVGVVVAPAGTAEMSELLRRADAALWDAKQGGDAVGWYDSNRDVGGTDRPALLAELRTALQHDDELRVVLQPVVDLRTGAPIGVEALARWHHPRRGLLAPAEFIRLVEHSDLLGSFTEHVVDQALAAAAGLARRGMAVPVAVNLSARSLLDHRLPKALSTLLRKHRVPGRRLVLEITETVMTRELPGVDEALASLRALGIRLAVDDFGTGYASLTFLTRVRLDEVKVDRALVAQMAESPQAAAIVRTTVELGGELGMQVVAEGVETAAQKELLLRLGCGAAQGFYFAEPVAVERVPGTLRALDEHATVADVRALPAAEGRPR